MKFYEYRKLHNYLSDFNVDHNAVIAYEESATYSTEKTLNITPEETGAFTPLGNFTAEEFTQFASEVQEDLKGAPFFNRLCKKYYWKGITSRIVDGTASPNPPCTALNSHMRILPDGTVPICQFNTTSVGNLRERSFKELWHAHEMEKHRKWVAQCPGCWAECEILPNALFSGDILNPLRYV